MMVEEGSSKTRKLKLFVLLVITILFGVFSYRVMCPPPLVCIKVSVTEVISQKDLLSTELIITKTTRISNGTLNDWDWILFGNVNYDMGVSRLLNTTTMSWEEYKRIG